MNLALKEIIGTVAYYVTGKNRLSVSSINGSIGVMKHLAIILVGFLVFVGPPCKTILYTGASFYSWLKAFRIEARQNLIRKTPLTVP